MQSLTRFALCALIFPLAFASQNNEQNKPAVFPAITSYSLDKAKVNLPGDLAGEANLLLISFEPEQQKEIDTWMTAPPEEALKLQRPVPDDALMIVARGEKKDEGGLAA